MPVVDSAQFLKLKPGAGQLPPLVLLIGEEETLLQDCLKAFESAFFARYGREFPEFNQETLNGTQDGVEKIIEACSTLPFGSEKKFVTVHRIEKLPEASKKMLAEFLSSPSPSTTAVFLWNDRISAAALNHELLSAVQNGGTVVKCWKPFEDRRPDWIQQEVSRHGKKISFQAAELLSEEGGESLSELKSEIEKLILFIGKKPTIDVNEVRQTMSFKRGESVWDLTEALEKGRTQEAGSILRECLAQGEDPFMLLNMVARSIRQNRKAIGGEKSAAAAHRLRALDRLLKSGHSTESAAFERLIQGLQ